MNRTSRRKEENDGRLFNHSHAIRQGWLKRLKNGKARYFVLWEAPERGPNRLEYYEEKNLEKPRKVFYLEDIYRIQSKEDPKYDHVFSIHHKEEICAVSCASEDEKRRWMTDLATLQPFGAEENQAKDLGCLGAWRIVVLPEGLHPVFHFQRCVFIFILNEFTFELVDPDDHNNRWTWRLSCIRNCGFDAHCFLFESGRSSFSGHGEVWLKMASAKVAKEVYRKVLEQMKRGPIPDPAMDSWLIQLHRDQKARLLCLEARYGSLRSRADTEPPPLPPSHPNSFMPHRSRSEYIRKRRVDDLKPSSASMAQGHHEMAVPSGRGGYNDFNRSNSEPARHVMPRMKTRTIASDSIETSTFSDEELQFSQSTSPPREDLDCQSIHHRHHHHHRNDSGVFEPRTLTNSSSVSYTEMHPPSVLQSLERMSLDGRPRKDSYPQNGKIAIVQAKTAGKIEGFSEYEVMHPRRLNSKDAYEDMSIASRTISTENHPIEETVA
eukprot:m.17064 g.17064  ORF g.17064 m.17064 type:complete len:493 (+) comp27293_c0_seq2:1064-2542(+)